MKDRFAGSWSEVLGKSDSDMWEAEYASLHAQNLEMSREAYLRTTTVERGQSAIPLNANVLSGHLLLFTPTIEAVNRAVDSGDGVLSGPDGIVRNTAGASYLELARSLEARVKVKHIVFGAHDLTISICSSLGPYQIPKVCSVSSSSTHHLRPPLHPSHYRVLSTKDSATQYPANYSSSTLPRRHLRRQLGPTTEEAPVSPLSFRCRSLIKNQTWVDRTLKNRWSLIGMQKVHEAFLGSPQRVLLQDRVSWALVPPSAGVSSSRVSIQ